jgi:hypothetical protein
MENANKDTRSRKWQLTINNPEENGYPHSFIREILGSFETIRYWCMADEVGEEGTPHTHLYIHFKNVTRFSTLKNKFPKFHMLTANGTSQQNRDYIYKEGKWEKDKKRETHKPETREEYGEMPQERQGARNDMDDIYDMLASGMTVDEIIEECPQHKIKISQLEKNRQMHLAKKYKKMYRELEVTYVHGETGKGKTRDILQRYDYEVYRVTNYDHPFDGYNGEDVIIFDEFRNSLKLSDMLIYLEGHPQTLPARYANRQACYTKVYIVSNWDFMKQYTEIRKNDKESIDAWTRRIHKLTEYTQNDIVVYDKRTDSFEQLEYTANTEGEKS